MSKTRWIDEPPFCTRYDEGVEDADLDAEHSGKAVGDLFARARVDYDKSVVKGNPELIAYRKGRVDRFRELDREVRDEARAEIGAAK